MQQPKSMRDRFANSPCAYSEKVPAHTQKTIPSHAVLRKILIRSEKHHMDTNIYNKSLANAKPNYERREDIFQTQKAKMTSLKATQKSKFFGGRNQTPPMK